MMNDKKGFMNFLLIFVIALVIFAIIGGTMGMNFSGLLSVASPVSLPDCNFGKATKGDSFVLEDFSRSDLVKEDFRRPIPTGWVMINDLSLAFDGQPSKVDCGRGCSYIVTAGKNNALNRVGSYVPVPGSHWGMYETKLNIKQQPMQIDLQNVHFDKTGLSSSTLVDRWYLFDGNKKVYLFSWGDGGDVANVGVGRITFETDKVRFCIDSKHANGYVVTVNNGQLFTKNIDLSDIKNSDKWYLGMEGQNGGQTVYLSAVGETSFNESVSGTVGSKSLSVSGAEYKSVAETNSNMYVDDIVVLPFTSPIEVSLPATQPNVDQVSPQNKVPELAGTPVGFFAKITAFIKWLFSPLTNLLG